MDAIFLTEDPNTRKQLIGSLAQSFGCVYVCLWSYYFPRPSNYLISLDGYYHEATGEPSSSSSRSLARSLFQEYRQSIIPLHNRHVPSMAFMNNLPYLEIQPQDHLQRLAYNDTQRLFYQEARIQTVIFMGCRSGEIELGMSYDAANMKIEASLREWFPEDFNRNSSPVNSDYMWPPPPPSSSSSSLRSLDSPNNSILFPLIPKPSTTTDAVNVPLHQPLAPINMIQQQQQQQQGSLFGNRDEEAMTKAILAVLTSPSSPPSTSSSPRRKRRATAFKRYHHCMINSGDKSPSQMSIRKKSIMKRAISFYNRLNICRRERLARENVTTGGDGSSGSGSGGRFIGGPTATQLHHMISERKRREKLNESFQALRSLLPPGTKKDKASVLAIARDQLMLLQGEMSKLLDRNRNLEAKLAGKKEIENDLRPDERFNVRIIHIPESTSRERIVDLKVVVKGENIRADDLMIKLLELLKQINNVSLLSLEAQTRAREDGNSSVVLVNLRLKIEDEWDESSFQEAVRRVVADLAH